MDYHQDRFEDFSVLVFKEKKLVGLFPANKVDGIVYSHQGLTYGGLLTSEDTKLEEFVNYFKSVLNFYKDIDCKKLQLKQLPSIYTTLPNDELQYLMFILKAKLIRRDTLSVINMKHKLKVSKDRVAGNKRALKHGLRIEEVNDFESFWNKILIPNLKAKHDTNPVHSLEEIQLLKEKFPNQIRQFNVYKNNQIVAGTTIFETIQVAHSQYISGNEEKNQIGSLDFLHMHLINVVFKNKTYFDFGISNEKQGVHINRGLNYWKEGFGARTVTQDFYEIDLVNTNNLESIFI